LRHNTASLTSFSITYTYTYTYTYIETATETATETETETKTPPFDRALSKLRTLFTPKLATTFNG